MIKMSLRDLMMLVLSVSLVIGAPLSVGCVYESAAIIEDITPQEAFTLIQNNQNNPDFVIIDVRTSEEFTGGHIENAINIDFFSEAFQGTLNDLDRDKTYVIYCKVGIRSRSALDIMAELNFKEAYNILGGTDQWKAEEFPTT